MKKILVSFATLLSISVFSQTESLQPKFKVEAGFQGFNASYEQPVAEKLLLAFDGGIGGEVEISKNNSISYRMGVTSSEDYFSPFMRAQLRYYFNRERRQLKEHSLSNNAGTFVGVQTKAVFNSDISSVLTNDVHFGQQLPLGTHFTFRWHTGVGVGINLSKGYTVLHPTVGASFGYTF